MQAQVHGQSPQGPDICACLRSTHLVDVTSSAPTPSGMGNRSMLPNCGTGSWRKTTLADLVFKGEDKAQVDIVKPCTAGKG